MAVVADYLPGHRRVLWPARAGQSYRFGGCVRCNAPANYCLCEICEKCDATDRRNECISMQLFPILLTCSEWNALFKTQNWRPALKLAVTVHGEQPGTRLLRCELPVSSLSSLLAPTPRGMRYHLPLHHLESPPEMRARTSFKLRLGQLQLVDFELAAEFALHDGVVHLEFALRQEPTLPGLVCHLTGCPELWHQAVLRPAVARMYKYPEACFSTCDAFTTGIARLQHLLRMLDAHAAYPPLRDEVSQQLARTKPFMAFLTRQVDTMRCLIQRV